MSKKNKVKYKDYIDFTKEIVVNINSSQSKLIEKYRHIVSALRDKNLTVKEIHDLYYNEDTKKYQYTIKTIYRYLEELEAAGIVVVAGHRITEGSRVSEKLYTRTGKIFYKKMDEEYQKYKNKYYNDLIKDIHYVLSITENKPNLDLEKLHKTLTVFYSISHSKIDEIMMKIEQNPKLAEFYSNIRIENINGLNHNLGIILAFVTNPELVEQLRKLIL